MCYTPQPRWLLRLDDVFETWWSIRFWFNRWQSWTLSFEKSIVVQYYTRWWFWIDCFEQLTYLVYVKNYVKPVDHYNQRIAVQYYISLSTRVILIELFTLPWLLTPLDLCLHTLTLTPSFSTLTLTIIHFTHSNPHHQNKKINNYQLESENQFKFGGWFLFCFWFLILFLFILLTGFAYLEVFLIFEIFEDACSTRSELIQLQLRF